MADSVASPCVGVLADPNSLPPLPPSPVKSIGHVHAQKPMIGQRRKLSVSLTSGTAVHVPKKQVTRPPSPLDSPDRHPQAVKSIGTQTDGCTDHTTPHGRYQVSDIVHDRMACMFRIKLDETGKLAALCYLPTRFRSLVEFYHTEIPIGFRDLGIGDQLVEYALQWAEERQIFVIPTCPFVQRHLQKRYTNQQCSRWTRIVADEREGVEKLMAQDSKHLST